MVSAFSFKKSTLGENITAVEEQSSRYAHSSLKYIKVDYKIRFAYEATDKVIRFTDYNDIKYRSRTIFSFHRPETLRKLDKADNTIRNNMKQFPEPDKSGFRKCQITAIENLDASLADNRPRALIQMATGSGNRIILYYRYIIHVWHALVMRHETDKRPIVVGIRYLIYDYRA